MSEHEDLFSRILELYYPNMTTSERRIADYLIKNPHESVRLSVAILARAAQTSEATVVRFARSLGFKGFLEMKVELQARASRELSLPLRHSHASPGDGKNLLCAIADQELANIDRTIAQLSVSSMQSMTKSLFGAGMVYTLGSGASSVLAQVAAYQLTLLGKRSLFMAQGPCSFEDQLRLAECSKDVLWLFSFPPYSSSVIHAAEFAKSLGIECIAITDRSISPLASLASSVLFAANDSLFPSNSLTASLILIRVLVLKVAALKSDEAVDEDELIERYPANQGEAESNSSCFYD